MYLLCVCGVQETGLCKLSNTSDIYSHILPSMQNEAAEKIDMLIPPVAVQQVAPGCTR